jgi:hypothetical protein
VKIAVNVAGSVEEMHEFTDGDEHRVVFTAAASIAFPDAILQRGAVEKPRSQDPVSIRQRSEREWLGDCDPRLVQLRKRPPLARGGIEASRGSGAAERSAILSANLFDEKIVTAWGRDPERSSPAGPIE